MQQEQLRSDFDRSEFLRLMCVSREADRREGILLRQGKGWFQVSGMGHEALAAIGIQLTEDDWLFPYYRDRALVLAKGMTTRELALAYFAKKESSSGGRQMPGHPSSRQKKIWTTPTPTASNLLPACGVAWAIQMKGEDSVTVATVGDAACRQGEFYEAVAFACERQLPIIMVVEDNHYGISTKTDGLNPFQLGVIGESCGVVNLNGRDPEEVYMRASEAITQARHGNGPTLLVCDIDRLCSHTSSDDQQAYRAPSELEEIMQRDPIRSFADRLLSSGEMTENDLHAMNVEIVAYVEQAYSNAETASDPNQAEVMTHVLGPASSLSACPVRGGKEMRMVDAVTDVFRGGLELDSKYVFFGQDIEDPKGGVFRLTAGLSTDFPERVFNSPLAEATIAGVAVGLACYGLRPVVEIQFVDFVGPAWTQISQNMSTLRWRSLGDWKCPVVLYCPYGAYLPGGAIWHSQSNESAFAHIPGLRVVVPSTPDDAAGLIWTAMNTDDPTIVLLPKHLFRKRVNVSDVIAPVPFGSAKSKTCGEDITLVTWGNCVELSLSAAALCQSWCSTEVIDLRSILPWDKEAVAKSLERTGRLVVVQEDSESCSVGQMIIAEMASNPEWFSYLLSPPQLVSKGDVHIGFNPALEYAALPDIQDVITALKLVMED